MVQVVADRPDLFNLCRIIVGLPTVPVTVACVDSSIDRLAHFHLQLYLSINHRIMTNLLLRGWLRDSVDRRRRQ